MAEERLERLRADERWQLAERIAASHGFARSPLLSRFLLHVVRETALGATEHLSEHPIGVEVFGRARSYRTEDDNIVRNYARQLRRRLTEYFTDEGRDEPMVLEIPTGGYVPRFCARGEQGRAAAEVETISPGGPEREAGERLHAGGEEAGDALREPLSAVLEALATEPAPMESGRVAPGQAAGTARGERRTWLAWRGMVLAAWTLATALMTALGTGWVMARRAGERETFARPASSSAHALWAQIFAPGSFTSVVPADAGFNLMEDFAGANIPVADYMQGDEGAQPLRGLNAQTENDLRTQEFTDFASAQIAAGLMRLPEYPEHGAALRFPRDLRLDDLRDGNVILIGSVLSNPWAALVDGRLNFSIVPLAGMRGARVVNRAPLPGEAAEYDSHWHEAQHDTWGIVALEQSLSGKGWILLLEGLDVAGTQSAADFVMGSPGLAPVLEKARQADGMLAPFEVLLHTRSVQSHAAGAEVVAMRVGR